MNERTFASGWDALADTAEEAANLRARAELMQHIAAIFRAKIVNKVSRGTLQRHTTQDE